MIISCWHYDEFHHCSACIFDYSIHSKTQSHDRTFVFFFTLFKGIVPRLKRPSRTQLMNVPVAIRSESQNTGKSADANDVQHNIIMWCVLCSVLWNTFMFSAWTTFEQSEWGGIFSAHCICRRTVCLSHHTNAFWCGMFLKTYRIIRVIRTMILNMISDNVSWGGNLFITESVFFHQHRMCYLLVSIILVWLT